MKTSKVISVIQAVNEYGEQKKWGNPEQGLNYDYLVKMGDGTEGIYSSKKQGEQDKFVVDQSVDYEFTPSTNPQWPGKIKPAQKAFTPGGGKANNKSFALSYSKDLCVGGKIEVGSILAKATEFNDWLEN